MGPEYGHLTVYAFLITEIIYEDGLVKDFGNGCTIARNYNLHNRKC